MKIILIGSFPVNLSLYNYLFQNKYLKAVCFQDSVEQTFWIESIKNEGLDTFIINKNNISDSFKTWLQKQKPDLVLVCGFSLKIPKELLAIPTYGFLNIHFGKLPENRGPDPLFWSLKNGDKETTITIHEVDEGWDTGKILLEKSTPIIPGETYGMVNSKMSYLLKDIAKKIIELSQDKNSFKIQAKEFYKYNKRPISKETSINWESQSVEEIESLVNACNPKYGGASTYYQGALIKIVEVSLVDSQTPLLGRIPGEIVHAHPEEGLYVNCKFGQLIKVNIISSDAGILTGNKYVHLGIRQGQRFLSSLKKELETH